jgi:ArsR family transcriptional regulator, lead/cadmium/zinc/bismuth-responsive transcriptional repressor
MNICSYNKIIKEKTMTSEDNTKELCDIRCIHEHRVTAAEKHALPEKDNQQIAQLFKAMGDANRLKVLWALEQEEMCVCDIAAFLKVSESAVSHQLRMLRQLQLVSNRREGPILYYRLNDHHISELMLTALKHTRE